MKKLIIGNTMLFAFIMGYIFGFKFLFGDSNILIAVMSITGLLMYLGRDLTGEPIKNTFGLIAFYLVIGIASFISANNIWLAIAINFLIVFFISYSFGHILKSPMYIPFTLLYLFLLAYPVPLHAMPLRLVALFAGAVSIMLPQFLINKNKIKKSSEKIFINLVKLLENKIILIKNGQATHEVDEKFNATTLNLKNIIYDKKQKNFYLLEEGQHRLDILISLEKINLTLGSLNKDNNTDLLNEILDFIKLFKDNFKAYDENIFKYFINKLKEKYKSSTTTENIEFLSSVIFINDSLKMLDKPHKVKSIPKNIKNDIYGLKNIKFNSIKITYAFRISIAITIACFIMQFFDLYQGRWIMYTVLSLTSPILEITKSKTKDRVIATVLGALFIAIVFSIFKNTMLRGIIVILAGYANVYCKTYRQKMLAVTISAIGAAVLVGGPIIGSSKILANPILLSFERVALILLGVLIAFIINSFLFKYDAEKANKNLTDISDQLVKDLVMHLDISLEKNKLKDYINNIYILTSQIDSSIKSNINLSDKLTITDDYTKANNSKMKLIITAYELNKFIATYKFDDKEEAYIKEIITKIKNNSFTTATKLDYLSKTDDINRKILLVSLMDINASYKKLNL